MRQEAVFVWLVPTALVVACGRQAPDPCSALEGVRQQIYDIERENLDVTDWTKARATEQKHNAAEAVFSELVATCTASHWSKDVVDCLVADVKAEESHARRPDCMNGPPAKLAASSFDEAEDRALTKLFGPPPRSGLEDAMKEVEDRVKQWEKRRASRIEPRVTIPARYAGFAWFSRKGGPIFQFPGGLPACAGRVLLAVEGYYQTHTFGGEPSLIAVLGMLDRDPTEACLQEAAARAVSGARLERDGAFTRLITSRTIGYLGWASDGTVYWSSDRAVVADAVAQKTTITANADVMALVARVDRKKHAWFVMVGDATSKLIGVPSTGVLFATDMFEDSFVNGRKYTAETMPRLPITIEFTSPADVQRAVAALHAPHPSLSRAVVAQLAKLAPVAHGRDLELDIGSLFAHPELYDELRTALERIRKQ